MKIIALGVVLAALTTPAFAQVSTAQEVSLGQRAAQQVEAQVGIDSSPESNQRLQRIAQTLVPVCGRNDISYSFKVLNSDDFNAMALPGGFIYATRGLMRSLPDGQLAFVMGHELVHVTRRHSIRQMENDQMRRLGIMAVLLGLGQGRVSDQSVQLAGLVDQVISSRYSQADEGEADQMGTEMLARAGIDPAYALSGLHTLAAKAGGGGMPQFVNTILGSHPLPKERIQAAYRYIPPLRYSPGPMPQSQSAAAAPRTPDWQTSLIQAVSRASGMNPDSALQNLSRQELTAMNWNDSGIFMASPAGEEYGQLERRLLSQELSWLLLRKPNTTRFGLSVRNMDNGERLVWLRVR